MITSSRLATLTAREHETFRTRNPRSLAAYQSATSLFGRVPMTWMNKSAGGFPLYLAKAKAHTFAIGTDHEAGRLEPPGDRKTDTRSAPGSRHQRNLSIHRHRRRNYPLDPDQRTIAFVKILT